MEYLCVGFMFARETDKNIEKELVNEYLKNIHKMFGWDEVVEVKAHVFSAEYINHFIANHNLRILFIDEELGTDYSEVDQSRTIVAPIKTSIKQQ